MDDYSRRGRTSESGIRHSVVTASQTEQIIIAAEPKREGFIIHNSGSEEVMIRFGSGVSPSAYSFRLSVGATYESPANQTYIGDVTAVWNSSTDSNALMVTELVGEKGAN